LGLHIAQSFVQQHGGTIEADSQQGRTAFKVLLPVIKI
jgi:two-component system nitrogen regulation sensor histidine kinase GlnL